MLAQISLYGYLCQNVGTNSHCGNYYEFTQRKKFEWLKICLIFKTIFFVKCVLIVKLKVKAVAIIHVNVKQ